MTSRSLPRNALAKPRAVRPAEGQAKGWRRWWPWIKRGVVAAFLGFVLVLLVRYARGVNWPEVWDALVNLPRRVLLAAGAIAALGHLVYSCFDLIGRHYVGHTLSAHKVMQIGFTSYAFNLNMGSAVGGIGFRLRLYSRYGLRYGDIARILTLSMISNWLGYLMLAGAVFAMAPLELPPAWDFDSHDLSLVGVALLAGAIGYIVLCALSPRRIWTVRGHELLLPPWRMALVQVALSMANWSVIAAVIYTLLQGQVPYTTVLSVFLIGAMAGVIVRVPAGLGVLEAVFIALLSHRVPEGQLLGALLAYRALYYMLPLAVASLLYLGMEMQAKKKHTAPTGQLFP
jgi:uncharacterized membrane protein YbhN (UPF0104 family)